MNDGDLNKCFQFLLQTGLMGSALEHAVPRQMFNTPDSLIEAITVEKAIRNGRGTYTGNA